MSIRAWTLAALVAIAMLGACETAKAPATAKAPVTTSAQAPANPEAVTFTKHIAPLLQRHCQECHRPESVAPFSLLPYDHVASSRSKIRKAGQTRKLRPGKAVPRDGGLPRRR